MTKGFLAVTAVVLAGCASVPNGPGVMVMPGSTKSFDQFRADDAECRQYSSAQVGGKSADSGRTPQQRYDFAFQQCMYARGHQIPMARGTMPRQPQRQSSTPPPPPPPAADPPPPPAGAPPPPPAGYRVN